MPNVPASSPSLSAIQSAAGGSNPANMSEYYAGSGYVWAYGAPTAAGDYGAIPASGAISIGVFRNKFFFKPVIASTVADYNIYNAAVGAGFNPATQTLIAIVTVNSGVIVYGSTTAIHAMDTGTGYTKGASIHIINNGTITGRGGNGGAANAGGTAASGGAGGPGLRAQVPVVVSNYGTIAGGGGGGGGGGRGHDGKTFIQGGGGGGGRPIGNGGAGTPAGAPGTTGAPGAGGNGSYGDGGAGGALGTAGSSGTNGGYGGSGAGGGAGSYVIGNGNVTWNVAGTRLGNVG